MLLAMPRKMPKRGEGSTAAREVTQPAAPLRVAPVVAGAGAVAAAKAEAPASRAHPAATPAAKKVPEIGGPKGPEPTRYGDWERKGRCIDF